MRRIHVLSVAVLSCWLSACELVADFDRGKLDAATDSAVPPDNTGDTNDSGTPDSGSPE